MSDFVRQMATVQQRFRKDEQHRLAVSRVELDAWGQDAQTAMQTEAVWIDRTGNARARLRVVADHPSGLPAGGQIRLEHGVYYGFYLETKRGRRNPVRVPDLAEVLRVGGAAAELADGSKWAIIQPTIGRYGPQLLTRLQRVWG